MTRAAREGLDPMPSAAELRRTAAERLARRPDLAHLATNLVEESHTVTPVGKPAPVGKSRKKGETPSRVSFRIGELSIEQGGRVVVHRDVSNIVVGSPPTARRENDTLWLRIPYPPRTKKNGGKGGYGGIRQREAYRRFRDAVLRHLEPLVALLQLPLPDGGYNLAATFYVDRRGEQADRFGLEQGLADVLEKAGVVANDRCFRTGDGTRIVFGDPEPRVECTITPI
jgi:hypothetical protein